MSDEKVLFANGIFEGVMKEIMNSQVKCKDVVYYMQPYSEKIIRDLKDFPPGPHCKWYQYATTTKNLNQIQYIAEIIKWENKHELSPERIAEVDSHIKEFQPGEGGLYFVNKKGKQSVNLITITNLIKLPVPIPVNQVFKVNDGCALKPRTQAGGWSYVYPLHSYNPDNLILKSQFDKDFEKEVEQSQHDSHEERMARLKIAPRIPSKSTAVSVVFKRNPDVVAEVINRANGKCELCKKNAPFLKSSDGSPYLEVHHWTFLSENGEDTVANATAICPNCHKRAHYGKFRDYIRLNHELPH